MSVVPPTGAGRFEIVRPLGSGTYATVWLARDPDFDSMVAIKVLAEAWSVDEGLRQRFIDEARALRRLENDRIVAVYDLGRLADGRPYMVIEHADAGSLWDRMVARSGQPFSPPEVLAVGLDLAECLTSIHGARVVHLDLKPSNLLYQRLGGAAGGERMVLGDFGLSRAVGGVAGMPGVVGTPRYMAPEQADPATVDLVDERTDLYAASTILYELLAGQAPFPFDHPQEVLQAQQSRAPEALSGRRPDLPTALGQVVHKGLARDPQWRFASAVEWREALRAAGRQAGLFAP